MMEKEIEKRAKEIGQEPAFPTSSLEGAFGDKELSKLEWFMGMALQGLTSSYMIAEGWKNEDFGKEAMKIANGACMALAEMEVANGK